MARKRNPVPIIAAAVVGVVLIVVIRLVAGGSSDSADPADPGTATTGPVSRPGCTTVQVAASSEKAALMAGIARSYSESGRTVNGACYDVAVRSVASGLAQQRLAAGWDPDADGPAPDVWTPAASTWVSLLRSDLTANDKPDMVPTTVESVTSTPLVLAMPRPMAEALDWPDAQLGWSDVLGLVEDPEGWAGKGHSEWGKFTLGKTNPTVSTSGLAATIGTFVAATGTSSDLTAADLADEKTREYARTVERSVVHYGDTTLTYLTNLQRADDAGAAMSYLSAVAVEEKSVLDYNAGNPSGDPATLGQHEPPKVPLVAIYPKEGTLYSDSPYVILDAPWADAGKKAGAADFLSYLREPAQQKVFTDAGFRTYDRKAGDPINASDAVRADGVTIALDAPGPAVLVQVRDLWSELRKQARVLLVMDVSGSMSTPAGSSGFTRLELAQQAAVDGLEQLAGTDEIGLWSFSTNLPTESGIYDELVPIAPLAQDKAQLVDKIEALGPLKGTPLYAVVRAATQYMDSTADDEVINAVVVMTDGKNEYPEDTDLGSLVSELSDASLENGVRVFSIAYGEGADLDTLKQISEASRAAAYDARNPESISSVFSAVLSNF
ncbi:substrate-binding and vWA domain-containing protein [Nakamurella alba]|uniref:substrate-binding and vWA domain-containing protein n=1 Tax=Nakamurella alba TaxID=2665158 RepID=UPI002AC318A4|nr:substrate-binding and VWA domain-containing protein [Nakamurella alba]